MFTANVADAKLINAMAGGFDEADTFSQARSERVSRNHAPVIGVPLGSQLEFYGDRESEALFTAARRRCEAMGARLLEIDVAPLIEAGKLLYGGPWVAERYAAVGDFIGAQPDAAHPVAATIISGGLRHRATDAFNGIYALKAHARAAEKLWEVVYILLLPTTPSIYTIEELQGEPVGLNPRMGHYTTATNLLDLAAIALPAGYRANGAGFGISFIGPAAADFTLFDLGETYMAAAPDVKPSLDLGSTDCIHLAVVGAHLAGMPLHHELTEHHAQFVSRTHTMAYRLYAMADSVPQKPALVHVGDGGMSILVEVYALSTAAFGSFVANVPAPLAIGTVTLEGGTQVKGFVCEPRATNKAADISEFGGRQRYIENRSGI